MAPASPAELRAELSMVEGGGCEGSEHWEMFLQVPGVPPCLVYPHLSLSDHGQGGRHCPWGLIAILCFISLIGRKGGPVQLGSSYILYSAHQASACPGCVHPGGACFTHPAVLEA